MNSGTPIDPMTEVLAWRSISPFGFRVDLLIVERGREGTRVAKPLEFEDVPKGASISCPTASITGTAAQSLMDALWQCGVRPTEGSGSAGSLAATERHLKDLQVVAMGLLRKIGVQV